MALASLKESIISAKIFQSPTSNLGSKLKVESKKLTKKPSYVRLGKMLLELYCLNT